MLKYSILYEINDLQLLETRVHMCCKTNLTGRYYIKNLSLGLYCISIYEINDLQPLETQVSMSCLTNSIGLGLYLSVNR